MTATAPDAPVAAIPERSPEEVAGELAGRLFEAGLGAFELATVALGARLGLYPALADGGPAPPPAPAAPPPTADRPPPRHWPPLPGSTPVTPASGASSRPPPGC